MTKIAGHAFSASPGAQVPVRKPYLSDFQG